MTCKLSVHFLMIVTLIWTGGFADARSTQVESPGSETLESLPDDTPIAQVAGQVITGAELRERFIREIGPSREALFPGKQAVTLEYVAELLVREKAMALDARAQGLLNDPDISWSLERTRRGLLINHFVEKVMRPAVTVTDAQIDAQLKKSPKITREQATQFAQNNVIRSNIPKLIKELNSTLHVQKPRDNMTVAAALYDKLLRRPEMTRVKNMPWILKEQMLKELTPEQASLKLATFDGGAITLLDLMKIVHGMVPVKRPKNLVTAKGIETVVDGSLGGALIEAHIKSLGLDKDLAVAQQISQREDQRLLALMVSRKAKSIAQPTEDDIQARFDEIKDQLMPDQQVKLQTIWCKDRQSAAQAKRALDQGRVFDELFKEMGQDAQKSTPTQTTASSETIFWRQLWSAEPNQVVGPIQGFSRNDLKWRVVKILEKKEGKPVTPESRGPDGIHSEIYQQRKEAALKPYQDELLRKYDHKVFKSRLAAFNPVVN
ncbi:MAG: peptidyl-prolyl cis-trans isomerase [Phycisphaeraceae bacterium]|nr:peptidyl-prolyl cis-trans isomerase [Phycisphaeraceae bacterium]